MAQAIVLAQEFDFVTNLVEVQGVKQDMLYILDLDGSSEESEGAEQWELGREENRLRSRLIQLKKSPTWKVDYV